MSSFVRPKRGGWQTIFNETIDLQRKNQRSGMTLEKAKRLKELEIENARLKKLPAETEPDKAMPREMACWWFQYQS